MTFISFYNQIVSDRGTPLSDFLTPLVAVKFNVFVSVSFLQPVKNCKNTIFTKLSKIGIGELFIVIKCHSHYHSHFGDRYRDFAQVLDVDDARHIVHAVQYVDDARHIDAVQCDDMDDDGLFARHIVHAVQCDDIDD